MKTLKKNPPPTLAQEVRYVNLAGTMSTVYQRLALMEILVLYATQCLGIRAEQWAIVMSIVPLTAVFGIPSAYIVEHFGRRKLLSMGTAAVARMLIPLIATLPLLTTSADHRLRLICLACAYLVNQAMCGFATPPWMSWIADIVPEGERGKFYSRRFIMLTTTDVLAFISAGFLLDWLSPTDKMESIGYVVVFGLAFAAGELDLLVHCRVKDRPLSEPVDDIKIPALLAAPWRHAGFRKLMFFRLFVVISESIVGPFWFMYQIQVLKIKMSTYACMIALCLISNALVYKLWSRIGERFGYRTVATISYTLAGLGMVSWWFLPYAKPYIFIPMLAIASVWEGFASAGIGLAMNTLTMNVAPKKHFSMYYAQIAALLALMVGGATYLGRWIYIEVNPARPTDFLGTQITGVFALVGIMAVIRIIAGSVLSYIIPEARADATHSRFKGIIRVNPFRLVPLMFTPERLLTDEERDEHIDAMLELVPPGDDPTIDRALKLVLDDMVHADEFYGILGRERMRRGEGIGRMTGEISEHGALHLAPSRAKAAGNRIRSLYECGDYYGCLRTVRRLANQSEADTERTRSARRVIAALANDTAPPREEAALLGIYALLQIMREPHQKPNEGK